MPQQNYIIERNLKKQYKRAKIPERIGKKDSQVWKNNKGVYIEGNIYIPNNLRTNSTGQL